MREILFKAKRIDNGEWVEGGFCKSSDGRTYMVGVSKRGYIDGLEVDTNTICQYTGFTDKNGKKIWENDLIVCKSKSKTHLNRHFLSQVEWDEEATGFAFQDSTWSNAFMDSISEFGIYECEAIGNIFDNPELMKAGAL